MIGFLKKSAFSLAVALVLYTAVEGVLFVAGVTPLSDRTDPYVGFAGYSPLFVEGTTPGGQRVFRTADNKFNWFNRQEFPAEKAADVERVFCLGGSTTYGRPYRDATSFCGWLREFLPVADPSKQWEVINAGGISYASYRVVRLMEELVEHDPDLFIVYTGHNEFLEQRTYGRLLDTPEFMRDLGSLASRLRLYSLLTDVVTPRPDVLDAEIDAVLDQSVGPEDYRRDDGLRDAVLEHFRISLESMIRMGRDAGAELVFVTPASNIRDFSPFKADPSTGLDAVSLRELERLEQAVALQLANREYEEAAALADQALLIDSRHADILFMKGRALLALGETAAAARAFVAARDEDIAPLRAPSPLVRIVGQVAAEHSTGLIDFVGMMEEASPDGIPGDDHFLDHVHPSIEANRLLGLAVLDELVGMKLASPGSSWNEAVVSNITERVEGGVDEAANAQALANVARVLSWAGKQEEALRLSERATEIASDPHTLYQRLTVLVRNDRHEEALTYAEEAVRLSPDIADVRRMYGIILSENGRSAEALEELRVANELDPSMVDVHYHLGVVLSDLGRLEEAERAYRTAVEVEPDNADALNNLGIMLARRGDYAGALELFERAVRVAPDHPDATRNMERARRLVG